jgi:hypothetical protein
MHQSNCRKCNGMGYFITYYGDIDQDPRRIPCYHSTAMPEITHKESIEITSVSVKLCKIDLSSGILTGLKVVTKLTADFSKQTRIESEAL